MNKKYIFFSIIILALILSGALIYEKFNHFIPTAEASIQVQNFTDQQIKDIRQTTPITEVKVYKTERLVKLMHREQTIQSYPMRLGFDPIGHK
ncbi:MAG: L,D-transpeptidase catalytic domain protein, partial [Acinetobacter sp.]